MSLLLLCSVDTTLCRGPLTATKEGVAAVGRVGAEEEEEEEEKEEWSGKGAWLHMNSGGG